MKVRTHYLFLKVFIVYLLIICLELFTFHYLLSMAGDLKLIVVPLLWTWWDARKKVNVGDKLFSSEEILHKVQALNSVNKFYEQEKSIKKHKINVT